MPLYSQRFDDIYFNTQQGLEETRYVFLEQNDLASRFAQPNQLTIGETGFGTGLNFLAAWDLFDQIRQDEDCRALQVGNDLTQEPLLEFISTEKYPLTTAQIQEALADFPSLQSKVSQLLEHYPHSFEGHHFLPIMPGRIHLHLLIGDATQSLKNFAGQVDAWFLDGFAPSKNPDMWSSELFEEMAKLSHPDTTFSTFTAASSVRKGLQAAGFEVSKAKGFGHKREMLIGQYKKDTQCKIDPWFQYKPYHHKEDQKTQIAIVGGGIAGCATAWVLSNANTDITIFDSIPDIAQGASGNPLGLIRPLLTVDYSVFDQVLSQSALLTLRTIEQLKKQGLDIFYEKEITQTAHNPRLEKRYRDICQKRALDFCQPTTKVPAEIKSPCYQITQAAMVSPRQLCQAFLSSSKGNIHFCHDKINKIAANSLVGNKASYHADIIILCTGAGSIDIEQCQELPIKATPGQISILKNATAHGVEQALCYEGYCLPMDADTLLIGATYRQDQSSDVREEDHQENFMALAKIMPKRSKQLQTANLVGRVSFRAATPDHLPFVGPIMPKEKFLNDYDRLKYGDKRHHYPQANIIKYLFMNIGHGSKGLSSALLSAYLIDSMINNRSLPMTISAYKAIHPLRFFRRLLLSA